MTLYIQHGAHKATKISIAMERDLVDGVILSPKNEKSEKLSGLCESLKEKFPNKRIFFDPQFHYSTYDSACEGLLQDYSYYVSELKRNNFLKPSDIQRYVKNVINYQDGLVLDGIFSPTVIINNFEDQFSQVALQLMAASEEHYAKNVSGKEFFHSLVINEQAFSSMEGVDDILNVLTTFREVDGFYVVIDRVSKDYTQRFDSTLLSHIMYFCHTLVNKNGYQVHIGYSDISSLIFQAIGVNSTACGWYGSQRLFSSQRLTPQSGGNQARPRYTSSPLLNSILIIPELDTACRLGLLENVATRTEFDTNLLVDRNVKWDIETSALHHWQALRTIFREIDSNMPIEERLSILVRIINNAKANYDVLLKKGVQFEYNSSPGHLDQWLEAILGFRRIAKLKINE